MTSNIRITMVTIDANQGCTDETKALIKELVDMLNIAGAIKGKLTFSDGTKVKWSPIKPSKQNK